MNFVRKCIGVLKLQNPLKTVVRHYEKKPYIRRSGYEEKVLGRSLLPRSKDFGKINTMPQYRPNNPWTEKRALFGQNDYIDILGSGYTHPAQLLTNIPRWLRGYRGNEMKVLNERLKHLRQYYKEMKPEKLDKMKKRQRYLYKYLNRYTNSAR